MGTRTSGRTGATLAMLLALATPGFAAAQAPAEALFDSELAAVIAATGDVNARSVREDREFLGAIFRRDGAYSYSVAPGQAGRDRIRVRVAIPAGAEVVAFWHTHGGPAPGRQYFSAVDAALVEQTGMPLYLADHSGALRVLRPGDPVLSAFEARRRGLGTGAGFAAGERVRSDAGQPVRIPVRS